LFRGTGRGFEKAPLQKHKRWQQLGRDNEDYEQLDDLKIIELILFNGLTRLFLKLDFGGADNRMPDRIKAFMADVFYTFILFFPVIVITVLTSRIIQQLLSGQISELGIKFLNLLILVPLYGLCVVAFNKDFYSGQSVVNRLWGYKVVDIKTGNSPGQFRCMLRNLTVPIFPFELPFVLFNSERRLGDFIAGTKLIKVEKTDPESILNEIRNTDFGQDSKLALTIPTLLFITWIILSWTTN
jgi:uncharacterized RDD family membrane protein YckC